MKVTSWSFYIGQGTSNLIEVEVNGAKHHILIDCGTDKLAKTKPKKDPYEKIYERTNGVFDLIIISHSDSDHFNGIYKMIKESKITNVKRIIIGGAPKNIMSLNAIISREKFSYVSSAFQDFLGTVADRKVCKKKAINFLTGGNYKNTVLDFKDNSTGEECNFRLLACRNCDNLEAVNANSAVVVCENKFRSRVSNICYGGDATVETFAFINEKIQAAKDTGDSSYQDLVGNGNNILITPHHGAIRTSCCSESLKENMELNYRLLAANEFAGHIGAKCIFTSAYYQTSHNWHPCKNMLDVYAQSAEDTHNSHTIAAYELYLTQDGRTKKGLERDYACTQGTRGNYTSFSFSKAFSGKCKVSGRVKQYDWIEQEINNGTMEEKLYDFICVMSGGRLLEYKTVDA